MCDCSDSGRRDRRRCTSASWCSAAVGFRFFMPANILIIHETAKGLGQKIYIKTQDLDAKGMETSEDLRTLVHHYNLRRGALGRAISPDHRKKDWVTHVCFQPQPLPRLVQSHFPKSDFGGKNSFWKSDFATFSRPIKPYTGVCEMRFEVSRCTDNGLSDVNK